MNLRTFVLIASLMSLCFSKCLSQDVEVERSNQSLAQFVQDIIFMEDVDHGIDTFLKYRKSDNFYINDFEMFNLSQVLFRNDRKEQSLAYLKGMSDHYMRLEHSMTVQIFMRLLEDGDQSATDWLKLHRNDEDYFIDEIELDIATSSLLRGGLIKEAKVLNTVYLQEFPGNEEAHTQMASIYLAEGDTARAVQYFNSGVEQQDFISFIKIASRPLTFYEPTVIPRDTTQLFELSGNTECDTAWVFVQGGPMPDLSAYNPRPLDQLPGQSRLLKIEVLQSQMINQTILSSSTSLTRAESLYEHQCSANMLARTVRYFKDRGKVVFVIGHSYGAYIGFEYLHSQEDLSDRLILMGSDLDEDLRNYGQNEDGSRKFIRFRDGVDPYETNFWPRFALVSLLKDRYAQIFTNTENLVRYHGERRMTKLLQGKDLSHVIFYHARFDEANARTTKADLNFWRQHGAETIETYGDHHSMLSEEYLHNLYDHIVNGDPLKRSMTPVLAQDIKEWGVEEAMTRYKIRKHDPQYFQLAEEEINALGYRLVAQHDLQAALEIFKLNVAHFPKSWNVYDSLGETYLSLENLERAEENYRHSLNLHPGNTYAIRALRQLETNR